MLLAANAAAPNTISPITAVDRTLLAANAILSPPLIIIMIMIMIMTLFSLYNAGSVIVYTCYTDWHGTAANEF